MKPHDVGCAIAEALSQGKRGRDLTGEILVYSAMENRSGQGRWAELADESLREFKQIASAARPGLFGGVAGLLFAASCASFGGSRYLGFRRTLINICGEKLEMLREPEHDYDFDLISGASGILLALSSVDEDVQEDARPYRRTLAEYLVRLVTDPESRGWSATSRLGHAELFCANVGLAHGVCGILIALSSVAVEFPFARKPLFEVGHWVAAQGVRADDDSLQWPTVVTEKGPILGREGWCYGTPAVALALSQVGFVLGEQALVDAGHQAIVSYLRREKMHAEEPDVSLCHGALGIAMSIDEIARINGSAALKVIATSQFIEIAARFDSKRQYGYELLATRATPDDREFLEGASGISLGLLSSDGAGGRWARMLGMLTQ